MGATDFGLILCLGTNNTTVRAIRGKHNKEDKVVVGIDVSPVLYASLKNQEVAEQYFVRPPVPVQSAVLGFFLHLECLVRCGFELHLVFDGQYHPLKEEKHKKRSAATKTKQEKYNCIMEGLKDADMKMVLALRKDLTKPREDILSLIVDGATKRNLKVICAPFEANWQLIGLIVNARCDQLCSCH